MRETGNAREMLTAGEAAALLRCSNRTVWTYFAKGKLPAYRRADGRQFFKRSDVCALFRRSRPRR